MLVNTGVVCPNPCLSKEIAATPCAPVLARLKWGTAFEMGSLEQAHILWLLHHSSCFPSVPLLMATIYPTHGKTLTFRHIWEQTHGHKY